MDRARKMQHAFEPDRLVRLMSYVYADVIKFIQRVHWMFLRGKRGKLHIPEDGVGLLKVAARRCSTARPPCLFDRVFLETF